MLNDKIKNKIQKIIESVEPCKLFKPIIRPLDQNYHARKISEIQFPANIILNNELLLLLL